MSSQAPRDPLYAQDPGSYSPYCMKVYSRKNDSNKWTGLLIQHVGHDGPHEQLDALLKAADRNPENALRVLSTVLAIGACQTAGRIPELLPAVLRCGATTRQR